MDNRAGRQLASEHPLQLGHTHIGMVTGPALQSERARLRHQGYCDALQARGQAPMAVIEMPAHTRPGDSIALTWSIPHEKVR